jgi:hypothetical protein
MMPLCLTCNRANPDGSRFCNFCGANLQNHLQSLPGTRKNAGFKVAAIVLAALACFALIVTSIHKTSQSRPSIVRPVSAVQDEAAEREWIPARNSLIRLESGIEHESQILLRTSIANAAAQLDIYARGGTARSKDGRVISARLSIKHLEAAMTGTDSLESASPYQFERLWSMAALDEVNGSVLAVKCDTAGKLSVGGVRQAHMQAARVYLDHALDQENAAKITPADLTVLEMRCADEKTARTRAEAERIKAYLKLWPLQIDIVADRSLEAIVTVDGHRKPFMMLLSDEKTHFDAHESVIIEPTESCALAVSVNGKQSRINYDRASSAPLKLALQ